MTTLVVVLLVVALVLFLVEAVSRRVWPVSLLALGLAFLTGALLVQVLT